MINHHLQKLIVASVTILLVIPGIAQTQNNRSEKIRFTPQLITVRELAGDQRLKSHSGDDFKIYRYNSPRDHANEQNLDRYRFLVQGGLHGNEKLASAFVLWLAGRYAAGESPLNQLAAAGADFDFLPYANPDGTHNHSRYNSKGVNLNRNFSVLWGFARENPGSASFSEPETKAIRYLFQNRQYTAAIDVHGYINWVVAPSNPVQISTKGLKANAAQTRLYAMWMAALRREMRLLNGYELKTAGGLGDGGAFEDWAFWNQGTLALCLELASPERFQTSYRHTFADITVEEKNQTADTFLKYEAFIYRMFSQAIRLKKSQQPAAVVVAN